MSKSYNIAVYWDFENIHISLCSLVKGEGWYRNNMFTKQLILIDIDKIMDYISGLGQVNINKAYANWSFFPAYSFNLQNYSIDLIQMFPRGRYGKNGADIRIAIDILEDCMQQPHIDCVVLVSGDSDYISIAQKVRQNGKKIIGIGIRETTNQYWIKACNEFKFYSNIVKDSIEVDASEEFDIDDAKALLQKSLAALFAESGNDFAYRVSIKPIMLRLDPSFDETNYGVSNFTDFLYKCDDIINIKDSEKDKIISLKNSSVVVDNTSSLLSHPYDKILKKQQIRLVEHEVLVDGLTETFKIFRSDEEEINSYIKYRDKLLSNLKLLHPEVKDSDTAKIKAIIYKAFCFQGDFEKKTVSLIDDIKTEEDLKERVFRMLIKRILNNIDESQGDDIDVSYLSQMLYGNKNHKDDIYKLIADYNNRTRRYT